LHMHAHLPSPSPHYTSGRLISTSERALAARRDERRHGAVVAAWRRQTGISRSRQRGGRRRKISGASGGSTRNKSGGIGGISGVAHRGAWRQHSGAEKNRLALSRSGGNKRRSCWRRSHRVMAAWRWQLWQQHRRRIWRGSKRSRHQRRNFRENRNESRGRWVTKRERETCNGGGRRRQKRNSAAAAISYQYRKMKAYRQRLKNNQPEIGEGKMAGGIIRRISGNDLAANVGRKYRKTKTSKRNRRLAAKYRGNCGEKRRKYQRRKCAAAKRLENENENKRQTRNRRRKRRREKRR